MIYTKAPTYTATIYVGLKKHYNGEVLSTDAAIDTIQRHCDILGLCVTVTNTHYYYTHGNEPGLAVGFINYPRFPSTVKEIRTKALDLAEQLIKVCKQWKVSVVFPDETFMISTGEQPK
jgi:hypothetical protein